MFFVLLLDGIPLFCNCTCLFTEIVPVLTHLSNLGFHGLELIAELRSSAASGVAHAAKASAVAGSALDLMAGGRVGQALAEATGLVAAAAADAEAAAKAKADALIAETGSGSDGEGTDAPVEQAM